ncbi:hypothetical protein [Tessaracoccus oleiagri]|uniref:Transglycosylase SLT domain-containing protein n=1 Tax=Tessaracoccus oleiagri TaxID=686624 RepID=A0A1G9HDP1_9ACTN|nr:hypothetical protein [Tessaracoccus oleiagri]SDL10946.1 hypothetical protein SAMN04488242_0240 [Tessaracoccus oleiagri]
MKPSQRLRAATMTLIMAATSASLMPLDAAAAPAPTVNHVSVKPAGEHTNAWGTFAGGANITVWTEVKLSSGAWSRSQVGTTDSSGYYVLPLTYGFGSAGSYEFRVGGQYADGTVAYTGSFTLTRIGEPDVSSAGERHVGVTSYAWGGTSDPGSVQTWTEVEVGGDWSVSQITTPDASGGYVLPLTYGTNTAGTYTFRVGSRHESGAVAYSDPFDFVRFGGQATANSAGSKVVGATTYAWGTFKDGGGIEVWTEVQTGSGTWSRSQTTRADGTGAYTLPLTYGADTAGSYTFRVAGRYSDGHIARTNSFTLTRTAPTLSGGKYDWLSAAGVPQSQWQYADYIVSRESGWNPRAVNPYSGACGLPQAYPCSKLGSNWDDPVHALKWQYSYVSSRYGGYQGAYNFWTRNGWY